MVGGISRRATNKLSDVRLRAWLKRDEVGNKLFDGGLPPPWILLARFCGLFYFASSN
jgi:hypothetical protein